MPHESSQDRFATAVAVHTAAVDASVFDPAVVWLAAGSDGGVAVARRVTAGQREAGEGECEEGQGGTGGCHGQSSCSGAPLVTLSAHFGSSWRLKTWDRFVIPKPFSRIEVIFGAPIHLQKGLSDEQLQEQRQKLQERLVAEVDDAQA